MSPLPAWVAPSPFFISNKMIMISERTFLAASAAFLVSFSFINRINAALFSSNSATIKPISPFAFSNDLDLSSFAGYRARDVFDAVGGPSIHNGGGLMSVGVLLALVLLIV